MKLKNLNLDGFDSDEIEDIEKTLFVTIIPTQNCDLRCWYCDVVDFTKKHTFMSLDEFDRTMEFVLAQDKPNIILRFYGGEPTIHPYFNEILDRAVNVLDESDKNYNILVTTNLMDSWNEYDRYPEQVILAPSLHTDFVDDTEDWFADCQMLRDRIHHISLMLQESNKEKVARLYRMYRNILPVMVVPIDQYTDTEDYQSFKEDNPDLFIDDSEYVLFYGESTKFNNVMCSSGYIIDEDGNLYYCWPRYGEPIMNVFEETKKLCNWHMCDMYCGECDQEVIRSTIEYYKDNLKDKKYDNKPNRKVLFRCNG